MIWKFITFFVRKLDPEIAHKLTIKLLKNVILGKLVKE